MYSVTVLDAATLSLFRSEHPWLNFPDEICEISLYFDDSGCPCRITAHANRPDAGRVSANVNDFGVDIVLALIRFAPQGVPQIEETAEEQRIVSILENLPVCDDSQSLDEIENLRAQKLKEAYEILRALAKGKISALRQSADSAFARDRLDKMLDQIPADLRDLGEQHKPYFLEMDLWRLAAVLRDEFAMPADYEVGPDPHDGNFPPSVIEQVEASVLSGPIVEALFELSPVAFSVSSIGQNSSKFVRVNQAYLDLVGKRWDEIVGAEMVSAGVAFGSDARARRLRLLDQEGGYVNQPAEIGGPDGRVVPVMISARRISVGGQLYDFEVLTRV